MSSLASTRMRIVGGLAILIAFSVSNSALAQKQKDEGTHAEAQGVVFGVQRGAIAVVAQDGSKWVVKLDQNSKVKVTGEGGGELLRPGAFVRFSTALDKKGVGHETVDAFEMIAPSQENQPGVKGTEALLGGKKEEAKPEEPPAEAAPEGEKKKPTLDDALGPKTVETTPCIVQGVIRSIKKNEMTVFAGQAGMVKIQAGAQPKVSVNTSDYSVVPQGAAIQVVGKAFKNGTVNASTVEITLVAQQPAEAGNFKGIAPGEGEEKKPEAAAE